MDADDVADREGGREDGGVVEIGLTTGGGAVPAPESNGLARRRWPATSWNALLRFIAARAIEADTAVAGPVGPSSSMTPRLRPVLRGADGFGCKTLSCCKAAHAGTNSGEAAAMDAAWAASVEWS